MPTEDGTPCMSPKPSPGAGKGSPSNPLGYGCSTSFKFPNHLIQPKLSSVFFILPTKTSEQLCQYQTYIKFKKKEIRYFKISILEVLGFSFLSEVCGTAVTITVSRRSSCCRILVTFIYERTTLLLIEPLCGTYGLPCWLSG